MSADKTNDEPSKRPQLSSRSRVEKAAAVLALLDDSTLANLAGRLPDHHRDRLLAAARSMKSVTREEQKRIAHEFADQFTRERNSLRGSDQVANRLESQLFTPQIEFGGFDELEPLPMAFEFEQDDDIWSKLNNLSTKKLVTFFETKPVSVIAIGMRNLSEEVASTLASELPQELARDSLVIVAASPEPNPLAVEAVEQLAEQELFAPSEDGQEEEEEGNGAAIDKLASILNRLTRTRREAVMGALESELSEEDLTELNGKVLSFEALESRLPRNAVPILFREMDEKMLLSALIYAQDQNMSIADYMLNNISQRLATTYRETMGSMPKPGEEEGEKAQSQVVCAVLEFAEMGRITLIDPDL